MDLTIPEIKLGDIPRDVLHLIMNDINDNEVLASLCMVDRYFNERVCTDAYWYKALKQRFGLNRDYIDLIKGNNKLPAVFKYFSTDGDNILKGFNKPVLFSDDMKDFMEKGGLGLSNPTDPNSLPLYKVLLIGQNSISSHMLITSLLQIKEKIYNENIGLPTISRLVSHHSINRNDLTDEQSKILNSKGVENQLIKDTKLIRKLLEYYNIRSWFL